MISTEFGVLCEKEYGLASKEAYEGLDREFANIREEFGRSGLLASSARAQAVVDEVLARFDQILEAFDLYYLGKWAVSGRVFEESEYEWLKAVATSKLDEEVREVRSRIQSELWEPSLSLVRYWERAEVEARARRSKVFQKIEILRMRIREAAATAHAEENLYRLLPRSSELLPLPIVATAKELFAGQTGLSGPQLFEFFARYSEPIAKMRYGSGVPSRKEVFGNFLESLPIDAQRKVLLDLCDGFPFKTAPPPNEVEELRSKIRGTPVPRTFAKAVETIDVDYVSKQWAKLSERLCNDPAGAITSARSLLESVCLHVLDRLGKKEEYAGDLPTLYRAAGEALQLAAKKEDDQAIRQILGSCSGIAQGVAALRNQFGDAHGRLGPDAEKRLAHLAANAVGALCTFLIESLEAGQRKAAVAKQPVQNSGTLANSHSSGSS